MADAAALLYLMQAATSAFPTGAFSHSFGFETLVAHEEVVTPASLEGAVRLWLQHGAATADGPIVALAWTAADRDDAAALHELDEHAGALKITRETREGSLSTGRAFLAAAIDAFGGTRSLAFREWVQAGGCEGHYAVAFGVAARDAGVTRQDAVIAFLHSSLSSLVGVAARIIPLGQSATQQIVARAAPEILACAKRATRMPLEDLGTATGWFDHASMAHERLYTRLCIS